MEKTNKELEKLSKILPVDFEVVNKVKMTIKKDGKTVRFTRPSSTLVRYVMYLVADGKIMPEEVTVYEGDKRMHILKDGHFDCGFRDNFFRIDSDLMIRLFRVR